MSLNDENIPFLKHLACELKVVQNGSIKWNLRIFPKFPVLQTDLDKDTFILCRKGHRICDSYQYARARNLNCASHTLCSFVSTEVFLGSETASSENN